MRTVFKWIGIVLGSLLVVAILIAAGLIISTQTRLDRTYAIEPEPITVSTDAEALAIGQHWSEIQCQVCHGEDLGGGPIFEDPAMGFVDAPNLTAGAGGIGGDYTTEDWVRAIRHGVRHDGKSVFIMPSNETYYLNDSDLGGLIGYMSTLPPVDRETRPRTLTLFAKLLYGMGAFGNLLHAEAIPHDVRPAAPATAVNVEYGEYLARALGCHNCHGELLAGAQPSEPGAPFAPNLTSGGDMGSWSEADFITTMRTGVTPSGWQLSDFMPWKGLSKMTDEELQALWLYLQGQPAQATAAR